MLPRMTSSSVGNTMTQNSPPGSRRNSFDSVRRMVRAELVMSVPFRGGESQVRVVESRLGDAESTRGDVVGIEPGQRGRDGVVSADDLDPAGAVGDVGDARQGSERADIDRARW